MQPELCNGKELQFNGVKLSGKSITRLANIGSLSLLALLLSSAVVHAQRSSELSGNLPNSQTMADLEKAEVLFTVGQYERAFFIYRNELVPLGDKYAQYMVGYMYQNGFGVEQDVATAAAWYQLAAERGTREFVALRDHVLRQLNPELMNQSTAIYRELRDEYCDAAVLLASIKEDHQKLQIRTGSRIGGGSSPVDIINRDGVRLTNNSEYYDAIRQNLEARLRMLKSLGDFADIPDNVDRLRMNDLEKAVREQIERESPKPSKLSNSEG